jgi:hypothetical protein
VLETLWTLILVFGVLWTWHESEAMLTDAIALGEMVDSIATAAPPGATVAIAADPVGQLEFAVSFPYHLAARGRPDLDVRMIATTRDNPTESQAQESLVMPYFPGRGDLGERGCAGLAAVVLFSDVGSAIEAEPCLQVEGFALESFTRSVGMPAFVPEYVRSSFRP